MNKLLWKSDLGNGTYRNPILFADYSDPDVIRVGDTYYMTASSFNYTPGLPVLTSHDLVNWKLVSYAADHIPFDNYRLPAHARGIWAPAMRFHEGSFYIYYGMPDEGIFMVHTKDPLGQWSEPVLVLEGKGLIDPCPLWDEDGKAYVVHGYARSRIGFKSILGLFPMSWDGKKAVGEDHFIYDGTVTQKTIEGPKIYKRNGRYYIFAPAGGVKTGWQTVLRSYKIEGPYEERIVMSQHHTPVNGPHQGGLTDTPDGEEWFIHFQDKGAFGRICHLQPVTWTEEEWPVIGENPDEQGCASPCLVYRKPSAPGHEGDEACYLEASDGFLGGRPGLMWQWMGNHQPDFIRNTDSLDTGLKGLCLNCLCVEDNKAQETGKGSCRKPGLPLIWNCPNVLTQKLVCPEFKAETILDAGAMRQGEMAGLVMVGAQYAYLGVHKEDGKKFLTYAQSQGGDLDKTERILAERELADETEEIRLGLEFSMKEGMKVTFSYGNGQGMTQIFPEAFYPSSHTWVGARFGLFAIKEAETSDSGYARFLSVEVESAEEDGQTGEFI